MPPRRPRMMTFRSKKEKPLFERLFRNIVANKTFRSMRADKQEMQRKKLTLPFIRQKASLV
jgi:hypothetical protein